MSTVSTGSVYKRCACREAVFDENGEPALNNKGKQKTRELGSQCPKLKKKDHGSWFYSLEMEAKKPGERSRDRKGGYETKDDAKEALKKIISRIEQGEEIDHKITAGTYLNKWIERKKSLSPTTAYTYRSNIRVYFLPKLGHLKLEEIRVRHIVDMFDAIEARNLQVARAKKRYTEALTRWKADRAANPPPPGRPKKGAPPRPERPKFVLPPCPHGLDGQRYVVKPATMQRIRAALRSALTSAIKERRISVNWAALVDLPSGKRPKLLEWTPERIQRWQATGAVASPVMVWSPEQTGQFLDSVADDWLYAAWHLCAFRGLRRGEMVGLEWQNVDLDRGIIYVTKQVVLAGWTPHEKGPKADSERSIALDTNTITALRLHKRRMEQAREEARRVAEETQDPSKAWSESDRVFLRASGQPLHPDSPTRRFKRLHAKAGLPPIHLHCLRHGSATLILTSGGDLKTAQEMLGHATLALTGDTYSMILEERARTAAEASASIVPRSKPLQDEEETNEKTFQRPFLRLVR